MKFLKRTNEDLQDRILELEEHAQQREQHIKAMEQQQAKQIAEIKDAYEQRHRSPISWTLSKAISHTWRN